MQILGTVLWQGSWLQIPLRNTGSWGRQESTEQMVEAVIAATLCCGKPDCACFKLTYQKGEKSPGDKILILVKTK